MANKRVRLTDRKRRAAEFVDYPGTVNQPDRKFKADDEYENESDWMVDGWELQDLPTRFDDKRDEIGFPLPTTEKSQSRKARVAAIRNAASKAVRLAMLYLGDKTPEDVIEGQAHEFMRLGDKFLTNALKRYAATENLYVAQDDEEETAEDEEDKKKKSQDEEETAEDKEEDKKKKKSQDEEEEVEEEDKKKKKSQDEDEEAEKDEDIGAKKKKKSSAAELDIEMTAAEGEIEMSAADKKLLSGLYASDEEEMAEEEEDKKKKKKSQDEEEVEEVEEVEKKKSQDEEEEVEEEDKKKKKSQDEEETTEDKEEGKKKKKAGIQELGGQPRVASVSKDVDLSSLWNSAPDVSKAFD